MAKPDFNVGEYNKKGRLVFGQINAFDHMEPFVLNDDYGVMLMNEGGEEDPRPLYILACQATREILRTGDYEEFTKAVSQIPRDSVVGIYNTCSMPRSWGLSDEIIQQYNDLLTNLESTNRMETWGVCYCPNRQ